MSDFILKLIKNLFTKLSVKPDGTSSNASLSSVSEEINIGIMRFLPVTMLFSMRRTNKKYLKLIDSILEKQCIIYPVEYHFSDDILLEDTSFHEVALHYLKHYNVAWKLSVNDSLPLTNLQKLAFCSFYAIKNYSIAKRISLAFSYDSSNIMRILGVSPINPRIPLSHEKWVNTLNITRLAEPLNYFNNSDLINELMHIYYTTDAAALIALVKDTFLMQLANLGVTYKEFIRIPLLLRDLLIFNNIAVLIDRKEIEFFIDPRNKTIFISPMAIDIINNILKIIPLVKNINGNQGKCLIDIKISTIVELYRKGSCRAEYLFGWLRNYLETLRIRAPYHAPIGCLTVDCVSYMQVPEDFNLVTRMLMLDILTNDDILKSKEEGYNLQMLQDKIADINDSASREIADINDSANRDTSSRSIRFTRGEDGIFTMQMVDMPNRCSAADVANDSTLVPRHVNNSYRLLFATCF